MKFEIGFIKSDILDHFPISFVAGYNIYIKELKEYYTFRSNLSDVFVEISKYKLHTVISGSITNSSDTKNAYDIFLNLKFTL